MNCLMCENGLANIEKFSRLARVTSDSKPWLRGGELAVCHNCGLVQKIITDGFVEECERIYANYEIYRMQEEQKVFDTYGKAVTRSEHLISELLKKINLPDSGRFLDVGCGKGDTLIAFGNFFNKWVLSGYELNDTNRKAVVEIPNVEKFYSGKFFNIKDVYDLIFVKDVLEHIHDPREFLENIKGVMHEETIVMFSVPDYLNNYFDLVVADHCLHFTNQTIRMMLEVQGFDIVVIDDKIVPKELVIVARKRENKTNYHVIENQKAAINNIDNAIAWLENLKKDLVQKMESKCFGIFGVANAANWIIAETGIEKVQYFVDEDFDRVGLNVLDRPVLAPENLKKNHNVYLPFPYKIARALKERLEEYSLGTFFLPPSGE